MPNYTYSTSGTQIPSPHYTIGATSTSATNLVWNGSNTTWANPVNPVTISQNAQIDLKGENADIVINGESLKETLQAIKEALRIPNRIQRDEQLERDFEEIKQLREKYEQKVKEYKEKQKVWEVLKEQN